MIKSHPGIKYKPLIEMQYINEQLTTFYEYAYKIEQNIIDEIKELNNPDNKVIEINEYDDSCEIRKCVSGLSDTSWDIDYLFNEYFPNLIRSSTLISIMGFFENSLNGLCGSFCDQEKLKLSYKDIHGKGIERAKNYLAKVVNLKFPCNSSAWNNIKNIQKLRNIFTHSGGWLENKNDHEIRSHIKTISKHIYVNDRDEIILNDSFLKYLLDNLHEFLNELLKSVKLFESTSANK